MKVALEKVGKYYIIYKDNDIYLVLRTWKGAMKEYHRLFQSIKSSTILQSKTNKEAKNDEQESLFNKKV